MAIIGFGAELAYSADNVTYTDVAQVTEINPNEIDTTDVDITHLLSGSSNYFREFMAGMATAGEIEFKVLFARAQETSLYALHRSTKYWRIRLNDEATKSKWICQGYIKTFGKSMPMDDKVETTIKVKLTGKPAFTEGS